MSAIHPSPLAANSPSAPLPSSPRLRPSTPTLRSRLLLLIPFSLWLIIFVSAAATPPLLDDADSTHAQAAQSMLATGDWVTLHVNGIRYLEKPPLPYWITAISLKLFAPAPPYAASAQAVRSSTFAVHFHLALTVLGLALLGFAWARRAFPSTNQHAALYTAIFLLTSAGVFLFTRVFIPDALLSLLLAFTLYAFLRSLQPPQEPAPGLRQSPLASLAWPYSMWLSLALAVLTKGLVAIAFVFGVAIIFLYWTRSYPLWRRLRPFTGLLLFFAVAAPWHILAGLRNTGGANGHGFFWFYFINEHVLRFLGRRIPRDYNKLPGYLYWSLHLVWLFPWSLFAPAALIAAWRRRTELLSRTADSFRSQTILLLLIFSALVLVFFSISTNQEYYTFPVYLPLLMLLAAALASMESAAPSLDPTLRRALNFAFAAYATLGLGIAIALAYGLWSSRNLPFVPDIGDLLAHRDVGGYTLSMSHFFDLTGPSFAALRLPAALAMAAFLIGPAIAWILYSRGRFRPAIFTIAATSAVFFVAAHIALVRFSPMLSSVNFARTIIKLEHSGQISSSNTVLLFGDQAFGSSIPFYLDRRVDLVNGRTTSMYFGSTFPDAPPIFLTSTDLLSQWGRGPRKLLFVPLDHRAEVDQLLGSRQFILQQTSGKALVTDRPLRQP
ncbi:MAG: ArnT family glycosyltransferase [Acidobacteriaceae bacterium]